METLRKSEKKKTFKNHIIRGQYASGEIKGEQVVAYKEEPGVNPSSNMTHLLLLVYGSIIRFGLTFPSIYEQANE